MDNRLADQQPIERIAMQQASRDAWRADSSSMGSERCRGCVAHGGTNRSGRSGSGSLPDAYLTAISHADAALRNTSLSD